MTNILNERDALATEAKSITAAARGKRALTVAEKARLDTILDRVANIDAELKMFGENTERVNAINAMFAGKAGEDVEAAKALRAAGSTGASEGFLRPASAKSVSLALAKTAQRKGNAPGGIKAIGDGQTLVGQDFVDEPVAMGRPASSWLDVVPAIKVASPEFAYLRQSARDPQAKAVARGEVKPTSAMGLARIEDHLRVYATLSEPLYVYDLEDNESLTQWVGTELAYSLYLGVERDFLVGSGTGEAMTGLVNTAGIQSQAFVSSAIVSVRSAITAAETAGHTPDAVFMNAADWQSIELDPLVTNEFSASPIDRVTRTLWGVRVVVSNAVPAGTAILKSAGSVSLVTDERGPLAEFGMSGESFSLNQVLLRVEGRYASKVTAPLGIVSIALKA